MRDSSLPSADLDLALVRSFTVVAEQQHFGRAAASLHITPSSLSRQITRLERQVGARLLDRTPRGSQLTEAGQVFLPLATEALRFTAQAAARARATAQPNQRYLMTAPGCLDQVPAGASATSPTHAPPRRSAKP